MRVTLGPCKCFFRFTCSAILNYSKSPVFSIYDLLSIYYYQFYHFSFSYVGNLDPTVTEDLILALFGQIGPVKGCKIIQEVSCLFKYFDVL